MLVILFFGLFIIIGLVFILPIQEVENIIKEFPIELKGEKISYCLAAANPIYKWQINVFDYKGKIIAEYGVVRCSKLHKQIEKCECGNKY